MKKKLFMIGTILLIALVAILFMTSKPYKPTSFVVDGENYSASVQDDATLILSLGNNDEKGEWIIAETPDLFVSDYSNVTEIGREFHIIPLTDGTGEMVFHHIKDDETIETYTLTLSISRQQKTYLQIDTVSFTKHE